MHLRRLAARGELSRDIVAIGPFWTEGESAVDIDAVALAGRSRQAVLVGEAKWARRVSGEGVLRSLERKKQALPGAADDLIYVACARETVTAFVPVRAVTARNIFAVK